MQHLFPESSRSKPALFVCLMCLLTAFGNAPANQPVPEKVSDYAHLELDILYISQAIKDHLDRDIRPVRSKAERAFALHRWMFDSQHLFIKYNARRTLTAEQTYRYGKGNCLSLSALYIAAARYVGLKAQFQLVEVPSTWQQGEEFNIVPAHVNAAVLLPGETIHVEFLRTFFDTEFYTDQSKRISDKRALAEYHNNVAIELLTQKDHAGTRAHLDKALELQPRVSVYWSNYGVLEKLSGNYSEAEQHYRRALKYDKRNLSALANLHILYKATGKLDQALDIAGRVERYKQKNPHYLAKLAVADLELGLFDQALQKINKAIRIDAKNPDFRHIQARAYQQRGQQHRAIDALKKARNLTSSDIDQQRFDQKITQLMALQSG